MRQIIISLLICLLFISILFPQQKQQAVNNKKWTGTSDQKIWGLMITVAGFILCLDALVRLKALENYQGDLVQDGIFSKLRHTMYLGFIFWIIGYPLFRQSLVGLAVGAVTIPNILFWKHMEECELEIKHLDYTGYTKKPGFDHRVPEGMNGSIC